MLRRWGTSKGVNGFLTNARLHVQLGYDIDVARQLFWGPPGHQLDASKRRSPPWMLAQPIVLSVGQPPR